jgi:hypothetical protein
MAMAYPGTKKNKGHGSKKSGKGSKVIGGIKGSKSVKKVGAIG